MEIQDRIETVTGFDLKTLSEYTISTSECQYAYRDSIFKHQLKNRFIITSVVFKLDKFPRVYPQLRGYQERSGENGRGEFEKYSTGGHSNP
jgi:UDP-N-acetylmuramate dehydrogenase